MKRLTSRYLSALILLAVMLPCARGHAGGAAIREYRMFPAELYTNEKKLARIALRKFRMNETECYLAVEPDSLRTEIVPVGKYLILKRTLSEILARHRTSVYAKALGFAGQNSWRLQNAGLAHVPGSGPDAYLTADLCPTRRLLDRTLFTRLIGEYGTFKRPVPIAIAVSGTWLEKHEEDLKWLQGLAANNDLSVTWVNHTYHHRHKKRVPLWKNFLLDMGSNLKEEIMKNEISMLEAGLVPSVFFRFPGLVSNRTIFGRVIGFGLVPLGSNAWLGKKQWPVSGSIILVHANGEEPAGIKRFLWVLESKKKEISAGLWALGDLKDGLSRAMKMY